jgi:hypothetical protein
MNLQQVLEPSGKCPDASVVMIPVCAPRAPLDLLTARAVAHIAEWSTYLPKDCVAAMIRDGWHLTV